MNYPSSQRWESSPTKALPAPPPTEESQDVAAKISTQAEGWEKCLREQITNHPRIALAIGLLTGVTIGWWVKR